MEQAGWLTFRACLELWSPFLSSFRSSTLGYSVLPKRRYARFGASRTRIRSGHKQVRIRWHSHFSCGVVPGVEGLYRKQFLLTQAYFTWIFPMSSRIESCWVRITVPLNSIDHSRNYFYRSDDSKQQCEFPYYWFENQSMALYVVAALPHLRQLP